MPADRPLTPEQAALAASHLNLARGAARSVRRHHPDLGDECESAACLELCRLATRWDERTGLPFATWAYPRLRRAAWEVYRVGGHTRRRDTAYYRRREGRSSPPAEAEINSADAFGAMLGRIPPDLARVALLTYRDGLNGREAAERLGIPAREASRRLATAIDLLKGTMDT